MRQAGTPVGADDSTVGNYLGTPKHRVKGIELQVPDLSPARFRLWWGEAPQTCAAVVPMLPDCTECVNAVYSGTIAAFFLDSSVVAARENATTCL